MSLIFWTAAKQELINLTFAQSLKSFRPNIPKHSFAPWSEFAVPPEPGAGDVVLVAGNKPLDTLRKAGIVHKGRTLNSLRETPIKRESGGHYLVTFDPALTQTEFDKKAVMDWDVRLAHRLMTTGGLKPVIGKYEWVGTFLPIIEKVEAKFAINGKPVDVTMDTETMGLYPWYPERDLVSISFTVEAGHSAVLYLHSSKTPVPIPNSGPSLFEQINWLLTSPKVKLRGANLKFDLVWIETKWGIHCTNFKFDTLLVGSILDENRSNSLNLHAKVYTSMGGYDDDLNSKYDKGKMEDIPLDDLLPYAGGDTDACHQVADTLRDELTEDHQLTRFYVKILHPAARAFEKIERNGIVVDVEKMHALREELRGVIKASTDRQLSLLPTMMRTKYRERIEEQIAQGKNPMLPSIVKEYFFSPRGLNLTPKEVTEKTKEPSLAKAHLRQFADNPDAKAMVAAMTEGDSASKTLSTFADGRFHPTFMLYKGDFNDEADNESGTNTGRLSAKDVAIQCMVGETVVTTSVGPVRLDAIVEVGGHGYKVLTHTGAWRNVIGVYRNGVRPVFRVRTVSGVEVICTGNHPILTRRGWVRTDLLEIGDACFVWKPERKETRALSGRLSEPRVSFLDRDEEQMFLYGEQGLCPLRREWNQLRSNVGEVRDVFERHGASPSGHVIGPFRQHERVFEGELPMGYANTTTVEQSYHEVYYAQRAYQDGSPVGEGCGHIAWDAALSAKCRSPYGSSIGVGEEADWTAFEEDHVVSVTYAGREETFDLTIEDCHSFVANGLVVHNTLPKKTTWAKKLRACYPAPKGKVCLSVDYSQGELKVVACVAPEPTMINAYLEGLDLHAVTGAKLAQVDVQEFLTWKDHTDTALAALFEKYRGNAKPANFGLLYGMSAEGFQAYAWAAYGLKITLEEATKMRDAFFKLYPGLLDYHDNQREIVRVSQMVRSPLGRIRHLPMIRSWDRFVKSKAERQAINSPIQSCLNDMMLWAVALIDDAYPNGEIEMVATIHDALIAYVPEQDHQLWAARIVEIMANLPLHEMGWIPPLQFTADAEAGPDLAHMKKLSFAA